MSVETTKLTVKIRACLSLKECKSGSFFCEAIEKEMKLSIAAPLIDIYSLKDTLAIFFQYPPHYLT